MISDCCNTVPEARNAVGRPVLQQRGSDLEWNTDNCKALFLNPNPVSLLTTAADLGQKASSNNQFGGFFSYFFKTAMENHFARFVKNVTWDGVMQETTKETIFKANHTYCDKPYTDENICKQNPFYKMVFGR